MRNGSNLFVGRLISVVGMVGLLSVGKAEAVPPGGFPACLAQLATCTGGLTTCTSGLGDCQTDLEACEAEPNAVFPGDGQEGTTEDFGLNHGPRLSYTDNGDGTFTDDNTQLVWEKKDDLGGVHDKDNTYVWTDVAVVFPNC